MLAKCGLAYLVCGFPNTFGADSKSAFFIAQNQSINHKLMSELRSGRKTKNYENTKTISIIATILWLTINRCL
jgi:hypothetical protein